MHYKALIKYYEGIYNTLHMTALSITTLSKIMLIRNDNLYNVW